VFERRHLLQGRLDHRPELSTLPVLRALSTDLVTAAGSYLDEALVGVANAHHHRPGSVGGEGGVVGGRRKEGLDQGGLADVLITDDHHRHPGVGRRRRRASAFGFDGVEVLREVFVGQHARHSFAEVVEGRQGLPKSALLSLHFHLCLFVLRLRGGQPRVENGRNKTDLIINYATVKKELRSYY
jgi:hypothetical protein